MEHFCEAWYNDLFCIECGLLPCDGNRVYFVTDERLRAAASLARQENHPAIVYVAVDLVVGVKQVADSSDVVIATVLPRNEGQRVTT